MHLPGKKPYLTPADAKGIKVNVVANKMTADFCLAMGANAIPTNVAEVASSSQTALIDTYPTPFAFYVPSGLNKVLPVMTKMPQWESAGVSLMNKGVYGKMPAELRAVDTALTAVHLKGGGKKACEGAK